MEMERKINNTFLIYFISKNNQKYLLIHQLHVSHKKHISLKLST